MENKALDTLQLNESSSYRFDIISSLIERNLNSVVQSVFMRLNETDMFNAFTANPSWVNALKSKQWLSQYFAASDMKTSWLMEIMLKTWRPLRETQDTSTILKEAFSVYLKSTKTRARRAYYGAEIHSVMPPMDFPEGIKLLSSYVNDKYIATVFYANTDNSTSQVHTLLVYDRWTFELVNGISINGVPRDGMFRVMLPKDDSQLIVLTFQKRSFEHVQTIIFDQATGKVKIVNLKHYYTNRLSTLLLLYTSNELTWRGPFTTYKLESEEKLIFINKQDVIRPLELIFTLENPNLECFARAIYLNVLGNLHHILEIRSKRDFSLLQAIAIEDFIRPIYLLSEDLIIVLNIPKHVIEVRTLLGGIERCVVYELTVDPHFFCDLRLEANITYKGGYLVAFSEQRLTHSQSVPSATVWHLPPDFLNKCREHSLDGTIGKIREFRNIHLNHSMFKNAYNHVGRLGITQIKHEIAQKTASDGRHYSEIKMNVITILANNI